MKPPTTDGRRDILEIYTENMPVDEDVDINDIAIQTEGFVGADIESLCREAAMNALREDADIPFVSQHHFEAAKTTVHPTMTPAAQEYYDKIELEIKRESGRTINQGRSNDYA